MVWFLNSLMKRVDGSLKYQIGGKKCNYMKNKFLSKQKPARHPQVATVFHAAGLKSMFTESKHLTRSIINITNKANAHPGWLHSELREIKCITK